jgi:hypothetical protein
MSYKQEIFADGIAKCHVMGGTVRFDLGSLEPTEEGQNPVLESNTRVVMPLQGFLGALSIMQQMADKLVENGVLKRSEQQSSEKADF